MENFICNQYVEQLTILNTKNIKICGSHLLDICRKFEFLISQGCVATCLRRRGQYCIGFVATLMRFPVVQKV